MCNCNKDREWTFTWNGTQYGPYATHTKAVAARRSIGATNAPLRQRTKTKTTA